jgi:hypothetical protein
MQPSRDRSRHSRYRIMTVVLCFDSKILMADLIA